MTFYSAHREGKKNPMKTLPTFDESRLLSDIENLNVETLSITHLYSFLFSPVCPICLGFCDSYLSVFMTPADQRGED